MHDVGRVAAGKPENLSPGDEDDGGEFDTTGLALKLYRHHFGTIPVEATGTLEPLDVMACWREGKEVLTLSVVNPTRMERTLEVGFGSLRVPKTAKLFLIAGSNPQLYNDPGKPKTTAIEERDGAPFGKKLVLPPVSVSPYEDPVK